MSPQLLDSFNQISFPAQWATPPVASPSMVASSLQAQYLLTEGAETKTLMRHWAGDVRLAVGSTLSSETALTITPHLDLLERGLAGQQVSLVTRRARPEKVLGEAGLAGDAVPFVMAVRRLMDAEKLGSARVLLEAAPASTLSGPLVARLRAVLAPPVVKRIGKHDSDRRLEYQWLREESQSYRGQWVALQGNHVLSAAPNLRSLRERLKTMQLEQPPLIHHVT